MKPPLKSTIKVQEKIRALLLLPWARSSAIFYSFFVPPPHLNTPPPRFFLPPLTPALAFAFFICQTSGMDDGELCCCLATVVALATWRELPHLLVNGEK